MHTIFARLLTFAGALVLALACPARAAIFTVTNINDSGAGSLREAVASATGLSDADTINFDASLSGATITLASTIAIDLTGVVITFDATALTGGLTIQGAGAGGSFGLFTIASGNTVMFKGLTLANGGGTGFSGNGGAIQNSGTLVLSRCTFSGNSATFGGALQNDGGAALSQCIFSGNSADGAGGAISNFGGMTLTLCTLSGNSATGGAIHNGGTVTLLQCTLSGNIATGSAHAGGAIYSNGTVTLTQCTLSGNSTPPGSPGSGGAISSSGTLTLTQCTLTGNSAQGLGGAIYHIIGTTTLVQCTLVGNSASLPAGNSEGGAIFADYHENGPILQNNIFAGNTATFGPDIYGTVVSHGGNLIGDGSSMSGMTNGENADRVGTDINTVDPKLAPLGNYGGPTQTMPPLTGSPAINAVPDAFAVPGLATDQRGTGFPRKIGARVDIGAVEFHISIRGDLNNDGNADILFQNTAGQIFAWYLDGSGGVASSGFIYGGGLADWKVVGLADLNGDGNDDILFQNTIGQTFVWYLNGGGGIASSGFIYSGGLADWRVAGIADLDGDGNNDILFQNTIGQLFVWHLDGHGVIVSSGFIYPGGLGDWRVRAVADVNADGIADILFQDSIGQIFVWFLDGHGAIGYSGFIHSGSLADWRVTAVVDMNGDGRADIVFQNTIGQLFVWYFNLSGALDHWGFLYGGGLGDWRMH
jgi:parallel beta-helix repeat protein